MRIEPMDEERLLYALLGFLGTKRAAEGNAHHLDEAVLQDVVWRYLAESGWAARREFAPKAFQNLRRGSRRGAPPTVDVVCGHRNVGDGTLARAYEIKLFRGEELEDGSTRGTNTRTVQRSCISDILRLATVERWERVQHSNQRIEAWQVVVIPVSALLELLPIRGRTRRASFSPEVDCRGVEHILAAMVRVAPPEVWVTKARIRYGLLRERPDLEEQLLEYLGQAHLGLTKEWDIRAACDRDADTNNEVAAVLKSGSDYLRRRIDPTRPSLTPTNWIRVRVMHAGISRPQAFVRERSSATFRMDDYLVVLAKIEARNRRTGDGD